MIVKIFEYKINNIISEILDFQVIIMNFNFQKARELMVENQLRPNKINNPIILELFNNIKKEDFLPEEIKKNSYNDLDTELKNLAKGMTIMELALHFKRKPSAISTRLHKIGMMDANFKIKEYETQEEYRIEQQIINGILDGCDPITGEMFQNQSCWKHPQILDDLKRWLVDEVEE